MCPQACTAQTLGLPAFLVFHELSCVSLWERIQVTCWVWPKYPVSDEHLAVTAGHPVRKWDMRNVQVTCCVHLSEGPLGKWLRAVVTHSRHLWDVGTPPACASQPLVIRFPSLCTLAQMEMYREQEQKGKRGAPGVKHTGQFSMTSAALSLL